MPPSQHNGLSGNSNHNGRRKRLVSRSSQRLILAISLVASLVALVIVITMALVKLSDMRIQNMDLQARLDNARKEIARLTPELEQTRADLASLAQDRLPYLKPLKLDEVTPIHEGYIRNIVFSLIRHGKQRLYEYKILLENNTDAPVQPGFRVMIFDRYGIQIGLHEVRELPQLLPGESTSQNATVQRFIDREPSYFAVTLLSEDKTPAH